MTEMRLPLHQVPPPIGQTDLERIVRGTDRRQRLQEIDAGWVNLVMGTNAGNFGAGLRLGECRKVRGEVIIRGVLLFTGIIAAGTAICAVPSQPYRPLEIEVFTAIYNNVLARVDVNTNGTITMPAQATANGTFLSLSGIRYYPD